MLKILELRKIKSPNKKYAWIYQVVADNGVILHTRKSKKNYSWATVGFARFTFYGDVPIPFTHIQKCDLHIAMTFETLKNYTKI